MGLRLAIPSTDPINGSNGFISDFADGGDPVCHIDLGDGEGTMAVKLSHLALSITIPEGTPISCEKLVGQEVRSTECSCVGSTVCECVGDMLQCLDNIKKTAEIRHATSLQLLISSFCCAPGGGAIGGSVLRRSR